MSVARTEKDRSQMNDEPDTVSLEKYVDKRFDALEKILTVRFEAEDRATLLFQRGLETRLEHLNEWRQQSKERERDFMPRCEYDAHHDQVVEDIRGLRESRAELTGKASQRSVNLAIALSVVVPVVVGLLVHLLDS